MYSNLPYYPKHGSSDERNLIIQQNHNEEKCSLCGRERLGHNRNNDCTEFKAKWEIDNKHKIARFARNGIMGGTIIGIDEEWKRERLNDAKDILNEIKTTREEEE